MPAVDFASLPPNARVWIFASDRPLRGSEASLLLAEVDRFLEQWKAHGAPLRSAREWRDDHFLVIGVDPTAEQASGCSIDGLYRSLRALEGPLATGLVAGGRVFYRDTEGRPRIARRQEVRTLAAQEYFSEDTTIFDTSITDVASYRERFELPSRESWVAALMATQASQASSRSATNASSARKG